MQFTKAFIVAATIAGAAAAPAKTLETRSGGLECSQHDGKWKYGWEGTEPSEQYICQTGGLINILNCVNILNGNTVNVNLLSILGL